MNKSAYPVFLMYFSYKAVPAKVKIKIIMPPKKIYKYALNYTHIIHTFLHEYEYSGMYIRFEIIL